MYISVGGFTMENKEDRNKQIKLYLAWYGTQAVRFEIIKSLYCREFALISKHTPKASIRNLKSHSVKNFDYILWNLLHLRNKKILFSLYYSLAKYINGVPNSPRTLVEWTKCDTWKKVKEDWKFNHYKKMESYDFVIDIDAGDHADIIHAKETTINIRNYFDKLNIPYEVRYSGKGFHFIIPKKFFPDYSYDPNDENNIYKMYQKIAKYLYDEFSEMVDVDIYDSRRVLKIPYTLALYPDDYNCYICFPLHTRAGLDNFQFKEYILTEKNFDVYKKIIKMRGLHLFNADGKMNKLLKDVGINNNRS